MNINEEKTLKHPMLSFSSGGVRKGKIVSAEEAIRVIHNGDTIVVAGFVGTGVPEEILRAVETQYLSSATPNSLTLIYTAGIGDKGDKGVNRFGHEGMLKRVIGGHWGLVPKLQVLALDSKIEAYNLPQGVISHMYRDIAGKNPRTISSVGLGTYIDPRHGGGKINDITTEDIVELIHFDGREYLAYRNFPINVAILRGTTADTDGNVTMEKEALLLDSLNMAMAAKNSGGFVIVQVERIAEKGTLKSKDVKIPGILVDCIVVAKPENHWQTFIEQYNPSFSGEIRIPMQSIPAMEMSERKIIARRAAFELRANSVVNLGIGMPEGVANVANEEKVIDYLTLTAEPGVIGGVPAGGTNFGTAANTEAIIDQPSQFDFYDGGGLDIAFLGLAQADRYGNLNVSKFGRNFTGCGGFINISQNSKRIVFTGTFTAGGLEIEVKDGLLKILKEGRSKKFLNQVEQVTFSGNYAISKGMNVLYITERCVFRLTSEGLELTEIAPGVDIEKDILSQMEFTPVIKRPPVFMDQRIFSDAPMGLKDYLLTVPLVERLSYDASQNVFFVNFEGFAVKTRDDIDSINRMVTDLLSPLGHRVYTIVNYDNFFINPDLIEDYTQMIKDVVEKYYISTTRYTTSTFLRLKLGNALKKRNLAPHIYETGEEARSALI